MLDALRQLAIFAKTVEHGSFRAAARALNISPSGVSHHIAQLEEHLGTALLYRSTRKLSVTEDGARLLVKARMMVQAAETGLEDLAESGRGLSGVLRINVPAILCQTVVTDWIVAFAKAHPKVQLDIDYSDVVQDLIGTGRDLAIRMGNMPDSALKMRKFNEFERFAVASPEYLKSVTPPQTPKDLERLDWIEMRQIPLKPRFTHRTHAAQSLRLQPRHQVNDALAMCQMARAGAGVAILPSCLVEQDIEQGRLVRLVPDWLLPKIGVYAVWPPNVSKTGLAMRLVEDLVVQASPTGAGV